MNEKYYLDNLNIFEVNFEDYHSYEYTLKDFQLMKTTPYEGLTIFKDIKTGKCLYGYTSEKIMGTDAKRYFIFEFIPEELRGNPLKQQKILISEENWIKLLQKLGEKNDK